MSLVNKVGDFLFGSSIKPNTGDKYTDSVLHRVYEEGVFQLAQNNYKEALNKFKKASSLGHVSAKYNQALMLFNGLGDYPDFETAKKLFIEAKQAGHTRCDEFLNFMDDVDRIMKDGEPNAPSNRELYIEKVKDAFLNIILHTDRQAGKAIYLISRDVMRLLGNDPYFINEFISDELSSMHLGNEVSIKFLKDIGRYDPNIGIDWGIQFENRAHMYMNHNIYPAIIKSSNGSLSMEDLVYSKCCVVNEVIKAFPEVLR